MTLRSLQTCRAELEQLKAERDALKAEVERMKAENFALAAGQCAFVTADEGGRPQCEGINQLEKYITELQNKCDSLTTERDALHEALNAPQPQPLSLDQISMIFNRVYPAQPLSQNIINLVQEVEKHHRIR